MASLSEGTRLYAGHTVALVSFKGFGEGASIQVVHGAHTRLDGRKDVPSSGCSTSCVLPGTVGRRMQLDRLQRLAPMVQPAERSSIPRGPPIARGDAGRWDGHHLFLYPFEGRKVHEALAMLLAYRLSLLTPQTFNWACNDDGLELLSDQPIEWSQVEDADLLSPAHLMDDLSAGFNASELVRRKFRDVATIAGLVFQGFPGATVKERHLLTSTNLLQVFQDHDPDNLLLRQAQDEMLADQLEFGRFFSGCRGCATARWCIASWTNHRPWPSIVRGSTA